MQFVILYVGASIIIAILGENRKFGFWGYFFASLLLTPLMGVLLLLASDKKQGN
ncbi:MAG: hypothetical protein HQK57_10925 [Deltaproteobacteria bacterium]|nr:hypothetical protein [Deltaproteobacteria bacterium]MBF0509423.1 hypothetical protein [Deltaproteobacteria bacterium]MBF0525961.1 hypothetical protein [Deltaproteobacteria bacterium]